MNELLDFLSEELDIDKCKISKDTKFSDFQLDSFDLAKMAAKFEEKFNVIIPNHKLQSIKGVQDLYEILEKKQ